MHRFALLLAVFLSVQACPNPGCDDGLTIEDLRNMQEIERRQLLNGELGNTAEKSNDAEVEVEASNDKTFYDNEHSTVKEEVDTLERALENEKTTEPENLATKEKRQICSQILEHLKTMPCDNPLVLTCRSGGDDFPCSSPTSQSPLRAVLADVDNILTGAETLQQPSVAFPSQISPIQTLRVSPAIAAANSLIPNALSRPSVPGFPGQFRPPTILTEAERRERQKGIFEGLLRFGTVVNHVDSFLTDKSKMIIRGLSRMVESEEDPRFN